LKAFRVAARRSAGTRRIDTPIVARQEVIAGLAVEHASELEGDEASRSRGRG